MFDFVTVFVMVLVNIVLLMYINPSDATVYIEFNWWVDQRLVGPRNSTVLKSIWNDIE